MYTSYSCYELSSVCLIYALACDENKKKNLKNSKKRMRSGNDTFTIQRPTYGTKTKRPSITDKQSHMHKVVEVYKYYIYKCSCICNSLWKRARTLTMPFPTSISLENQHCYGVSRLIKIIGIKHVFRALTLAGSPGKLFEHKAVWQSDLQSNKHV